MIRLGDLEFLEAPKSLMHVYVCYLYLEGTGIWISPESLDLGNISIAPSYSEWCRI